MSADMDVVEGLNAAGGATDLAVSVGSVIGKIAPTKRKCAIELSNDSSKYILCNPSVHFESGRCTAPLPPRIGPSSSGAALFTKPPLTAKGSAGILTYELLSVSTKTSSKKIAVMFKVPFNLKQKANEYAVGVTDVSKQCDRHLFHEMSKTTNATFVRGRAKDSGLSHKSQEVTIMATMSDCYEPIIKVHVADS